MLPITLTGFATGLGLIASIGAQNAFMLKQALRGGPLRLLVTICILADVLLIVGGIAAVAVLDRTAPWFTVGLTWAGVAFLLLYGTHSAKSALFPPASGPLSAEDLAADDDALPKGGFDGDDEIGAGGDDSPVDAPGRENRELGRGVATLERPRAAVRRAVMPTVLTLLALTFLNPHSYVDVVVLLGTVANSHGEIGRWFFGAGAVAASIVWFCAMAIAASRLARFLSSPEAWRMIDAGVAVLMFVLAGGLVLHVLG